MSDLLRFGVSIEDGLLENFDRVIAERGYATRSEALRDLIREALVQARLEKQQEATETVQLQKRNSISISPALRPSTLPV